MDPLADFLHSVARNTRPPATSLSTPASSPSSGAALAELLSSGVASLSTSGALQPGQDYTSRVASALRLDASDRFVTFISAFLSHVSQHRDVREVGRGGMEGGYAEVKTTCESWAGVYSRAAAVFALQDGAWIGVPLRFLATTLVALAGRADASPGAPPGQLHLMDAAGRVSKSAGVAAVDRTPSPAQETKRAHVLWLANVSFRAYFKLRNFRLCDTVLSSVESAFHHNIQNMSTPGGAAAADAAEACYSRADRVAYRYYLGRLRLSQHNVRQAYNHLRWAFDNCTARHMHNKRLILVPLIVSALVLGVYPTRLLLRSADAYDEGNSSGAAAVTTTLESTFGTLTERLRLGDGAGVMAELRKHAEWHRKRGHYLLLHEKLPVTAWRNLLRRCYLCALALAPPAAPPPQAMDSAPTSAATTATAATGGTRAPPPTLSLEALLAAARFSWRDESLTADDVECVAASLIDQGYLKGYASHASQKLVFARNNRFPRVDAVY